LDAFLQSIQDLDLGIHQLDLLFVDDNDDPASSALLRELRFPGSISIAPGGSQVAAYTVTDIDHQWTAPLLSRVAVFRDQLLAHALQHGYEGILLADSDLVLQPGTLLSLIDARVDICSEVFWTRWTPDAIELPNVWQGDQYRLYRQERGEELNAAETWARTEQFLAQLRTPGVHEVGGLGACTLISRRALLRGVSYAPLPNISLIGEDRDFCVRAAALGFTLYADTHAAPLHLYRERDLDRVEKFREAHPPRARTITPAGEPEIGRIVPPPEWPAPMEPSSRRLVPRRSTGNLVTLSMVVRNEADRYLRRVLERVRPVIAAAVIVDDASEDETVAICRDVLGGLPLRIVELPSSRFHREHELRRLQWHETLRTDPDWILNLDADELFGDDPAHDFPLLINQTEHDLYGFKLFNMWDEDHFRTDVGWDPGDWFAPLLLRPSEDIADRWRETNQHCGRWPLDVYDQLRITSRLRVQHLGWADQRERARKYRRYLELDLNPEPEQRALYESILDPNPPLTRWKKAAWEP
jgi:hypothetical protein